jgi:hypothetical protein
MGLFDQLGDVLKQYANTSASGQANPQAAAHFDQVAQAAPSSSLADGLAAAFRSNSTPDFGQMLGGLFNNSTGDQKAGILNHLLASAGPGVLSQLTAAGGAGGLTALLAGGASKLTPEQAQSVSPEVVQQLAAHAEKADPSLIDKASAFYSEHPALIKTLGGAALTIAMAKMAEKHSA